MLSLQRRYRITGVAGVLRWSLGKRLLSQLALRAADFCPFYVLNQDLCSLKDPHRTDLGLGPRSAKAGCFSTPAYFVILFSLVSDEQIIGSTAEAGYYLEE